MAKPKKQSVRRKAQNKTVTKQRFELKQLIFWIVIGTIIAEAISYLATNYLTSNAWEMLDLYIPAVAAALIGGVVAGAMMKDKKVGVISGLAVGVVYSIVNLIQLFYVAVTPDMLPPFTLIIYTMLFWIVFAGLGGVIGIYLLKRN